MIFDDYNGVTYCLNLDRINEYLFKSQKEKNCETEIVENYEKKDGSDSDKICKQNLQSKTIREIKTNGNTQLDTLKYDFFKQMFGILVNYDPSNEGNASVEGEYYDEEGNAFSVPLQGIMGTTFSEKLIFNTFLANGFIYTTIYPKIHKETELEEE